MSLLRAVSKLPLVLLLSGCAGPMGPPLGLGPDMDGLAGLAILTILFAVLYRPLQKFIRGRHGVHHTHSPKDIAKERYARGELTQEEFQRMMQQLSESQGDSA